MFENSKGCYWQIWNIYKWMYLVHISFFFFVIIVYSGAQDVCALMMKHGLTPDGKMWVYFNPFPPKSEEKWFLFKLTYTYWYLFLVSVNTKFSQLKFTYALELSQPTKWGILLFCTIAMMKLQNEFREAKYDPCLHQIFTA